MPEPLTLERFEKFEKTIERRFDAIDRRFDEFERHFDDFVEKVYTPDHAELVKRLDAIDKMLWQGQRLEQMAQRILSLAEATGHHELAVPFIASPGMAESAKS